MKKINLISQKLKNAAGGICMLTLILLASCDNAEPEDNLVVAVQETETIYNSSSMTEKGASFGNGINLQPSYTSGGNNLDLGWNLMNNYKSKIKTVRIEVEPGSEYNAKTWINEAKQKGYKVIVTYHKVSENGKSNNEALQAAARWWVKNYKSFGGNITINLMNEWGYKSITSIQFADQYNAAISQIRNVYQGPIIIDAPGYGQCVQTFYNAVTGNNSSKRKINDRNIILSLHIYSDSYNITTNKHISTGDLDLLNKAGLPCMIGEFGPRPNQSDSNFTTIVRYAKNNLGWPVLGWAWGGDGEKNNLLGGLRDSNYFLQKNKSNPNQYKPNNTNNYFNRIYQEL